MTFAAFITRFDFPGSIVLLEGKREVAEPDKKKLAALGLLHQAQDCYDIGWLLIRRISNMGTQD